MNPGDIRKLLGGFAAGTLTAEERRALFEAALTDQDLFNELAREEALKELLEEPAARRQLLAVLEEKPTFIDRLRAWMERPVAWVAVGSLVAGTVLVVVLVRRPQPATPEKVLVAQRQAPREPEVESNRAPSIVSEDKRRTASVPVPSARPRTVSQTAADREKGAVAPIAIPAAPSAPVQKAQPAVPFEIAEGQETRADAVVQPSNAVEVQPGVVSEGNNAVRSDFRETRPAGVVGGIAGAAGGSARSQGGRGGRGGGGGGAGPPPPAPKPVMAQAESVVMSGDAVDSTLQALEASRGEARQALSLSAVAVADEAADKRLNAAIVPPPVPYKILRAGADGKFAEATAKITFRAADRVRVVFSPPGPGRLAVTAANRPKPLLDRAVRQGTTVNLDVPALVSSLQVTFTAQPARSGGAAGIQPAAAPAPVTFSIAIPREPAP